MVCVWLFDGCDGVWGGGHPRFNPTISRLDLASEVGGITAWRDGG